MSRWKLSFLSELREQGFGVIARARLEARHLRAVSLSNVSRRRHLK